MVMMLEGMSAYDSLSLQHNGPIPPHLIHAADRIDRERRRKQQQKSRKARVVVARTRLKPKTIINIMAIAMIDAWAARGEVTEEDFRRAGISKADMAEHRDAAFQRACTLEPRIATLTQ